MSRLGCSLAQSLASCYPSLPYENHGIMSEMANRYKNENMEITAKSCRRQTPGLRDAGIDGKGQKHQVMEGPATFCAMRYSSDQWYLQ